MRRERLPVAQNVTIGRLGSGATSGRRVSTSAMGTCPEPGMSATRRSLAVRTCFGSPPPPRVRSRGCRRELRSSEDSQARSGYRDGPMSRRTRLILVAAVAAAAALGVIGGAALLGGYDEADALPKGVPPFVVDLGVRTG